MEESPEDALYTKLNQLPFITPDIINSIRHVLSKKTEREKYAKINRLSTSCDFDFSEQTQFIIERLNSTYTDFTKTHERFISIIEEKYLHYSALVSNEEYSKYSTLIYFLFTTELENIEYLISE